MASDLVVIMGASEDHGTLSLYQRQLEMAGIDYIVIGTDDKPNINGGGNLGYRVKKFRELAQCFAHYSRIVISDAFDVTFYGTKEDVIRKIPLDRLIHAAEKNCYPPESQSLVFPSLSPWRYANGGLVAGSPAAFIDWCNLAEAHPLYSPHALDQHFLNIQTSEGMEIDTRTELFYCLFGGYDELQFERGLPINTLCGTHPNFLHANGKWTADEMFDRYRRSLL
jgi:hypothetical protein